MNPPPPLPTVDVEIPAWPVVDRARRRLDTARSVTGRVATIAGATAAAVGLFTSKATGVCLLADAVLVGAGLAALRLWKPGGHQKATATVLYLMPGASLAGLLLGEQIVAGPHWSEALALTAWTTATWVLRPARLARQMMTPPPPPAPSVDLEPVAETVDHHPAAHWWAANVAVTSGPGPDTLLEDIEQVGPESVRATIRSADPGKPVPKISIEALSALMDVPEELITIGPVPGRGAGVRRLTIGKAATEEADPAAVWAQRIAPAAMPGTVLTAVRTGRLGVPGKENDA